MTQTLIGYARCSTDKQDLAAQQEALLKLGVAPDRIYTDPGFTGTNRARPGLDQALAAVRNGDSLGLLGQTERAQASIRPLRLCAMATPLLSPNLIDLPAPFLMLARSVTILLLEE
ncbi:DNA resolvase [Pseudomonas syringae pv. actinidiae ICMP 19104]|nr:DNA resolvase [Pseudomonas syringae pv. actinidiae ICMP 19104]